jgi:hypothetical protein
MSAPRPSSLIIDDDDDWGALSPLNSAPSLVPSSGSSGEFNAFAVVGSVTGGGASVRFGFFLRMLRLLA